MTDVPQRVELTGWGRTAPSHARVHRPSGTGDVTRLVQGAGHRGLIARGLGRSYGDAAQNGGGDVVSTRSLPRAVHVDAPACRIEVDAGTSIRELIDVLLPQGLFVPVTPGTGHVTVGGAVAADVHGKNHHADGSIGHALHWLDLVLPSGELRRVSPDEQPDLFWATVGGMGLTGVVVRASMAVRPVETPLMAAVNHALPDLDSLLAAMTEADGAHPYTVAWIDLVARGARTGRGVLTVGDHARRDDVPARRRTGTPRSLPAPVVPRGVPGGLLNRRTVALFNELWWRKAPSRPTASLMSVPAFFHPLDGLRDWNRVYGADGLVQYQLVVPRDRVDVIERAVSLVSQRQVPTFLAVLKLFGPGNAGWLSFPMEGWTLAMDMPARTPGLAALLDELDDAVTEAGGRVYLAKDSVATPATVARMYPRLDAFRQLRSEIDPGGRMTSDLSRRLAL